MNGWLVALACGLLLCALLIIAGVALWFTTYPFLVKFMLSALAILSGIALASIGIELWRDEL